MTDEFVMTNSELYRHYPVPDRPANWTLQRHGEMINGKFYWSLFDGGKYVDTTKKPCTLEAARRYAKVYIDDATRQEASK